VGAEPNNHFQNSEKSFDWVVEEEEEEAEEGDAEGDAEGEAEGEAEEEEPGPPHLIQQR
jgi:hypothetical protein